MSSSEVLDFEKICRLCLSEKRSMSAIFSKKKSDCKVPLSVRIMSCGALQLYEGDGLPASICSKCLANVNQSYAFREQCEQADNTLRQYLQRKNEIADEEEPKIEAELQLETEPEPEMDLETENEPEASTKMDTEEIMIKVEPADIIETINASVHSPTLQQKLKDNNNIDEINIEDGDVFKMLSSLRGVTVKRTHTTDMLQPTLTQVANTSSSCSTTPTQSLQTLSSSMTQEDKARMKEGDKYISCKECGMVLKRENLLCHVRYKHNQVRNHLCQECGYRAFTAFMLRGHIESVHKSIQVTCDICCKKFKSSRRLKVHVNERHRGKQFVCEHCGRKFPVLGHLKRHLFVHSDEPQFTCEWCHKKFKHKFPFRLHVNLHLGIKPYKCTYCQECFTQNVLRKLHEFKIHGNEEYNPKNKTPRQGPKLKRNRLK